MSLTALLARSLESARQAVPSTDLSSGALHRWRSSQWVESLAARMREAYVADPDIRVLSKLSALHRREFGLNELLYDVLVCRVASVGSARHRAPLVYVHDTLWQVESELARDSRAALIDFNKLVLGTADNKLFVGPLVHDVPAYLATLLPAARRCTNTVYVALISHPDEWATTGADGDVRVWRFDG